jgi:hypothetical protein
MVDARNAQYPHQLSPTLDAMMIEPPAAHKVPAHSIRLCHRGLFTVGLFTTAQFLQEFFLAKLVMAFNPHIL